MHRPAIGPPCRPPYPNSVPPNSNDHPSQPGLKLCCRGGQVDGFEPHPVTLDGHCLIHNPADLGAEEEALAGEGVGHVRPFLAAQIGVKLIEIAAFQDLVAIAGLGRDRAHAGGMTWAGHDRRRPCATPQPSGCNMMRRALPAVCSNPVPLAGIGMAGSMVVAKAIQGRRLSRAPQGFSSAQSGNLERGTIHKCCGSLQIGSG
jgi:hypothetical protein